MNFYRPQKRKRARSGIRDNDGPIRCPGHLKWVRGRECLIAPKHAAALHQCSGKIEAHHVQSYRAIEGGMGMKVGDDKTVPLCSNAHWAVHAVGQRAFEIANAADLEAAAKTLWDSSPHGKKYRLQQGERA